MIKAVIFDFDGVILESSGIKTEAFRELFSGYEAESDRIVKYHLENGGISRYVKFRYIYENILKKELSAPEESELGRRFEHIVFKKVMKAPFVAGAEEFLKSYFEKYSLFIASGTPEEELLRIVKGRGLEMYFKEVHGSPKQKELIIKDIMRIYFLTAGQVVYVGDAPSDSIAARAAGVIDIERDPSMGSGRLGNKIADMSHLEEVLQENEK